MTNFKKITVKGATVLALVAILAASTAPAQANPNFSFSFNFGNGGYSQPRPVVQHCMPNQRIIRRLENQGYTNVRFAGEQYRNFPQFYARSGFWLYTLQVNRCNGEVRILGRQRAPMFNPRPQFPFGGHHNQPSFNGGFGITFNHN